MSKVAAATPCSLVPDYIDAAVQLPFDSTLPAAD